VRRWRRAYQRSLLAQTLALNSLLVFSTGALISGIFVVTMRRLVIQQVELRAASMAKLVAARAEFPMLVGDRSELKRLAQETMLLEDVLYVVITDTDDGAGVALGRPGFPRPGRPASPAPVGPATSVARMSRNFLGGAEYVDVELAIPRPDSHDLLGMGESTAGSAQPFIGTVRIGLSLRQGREASVAAVGRALGVAAVCLALVLWLQSRQLRRLLAPMRNLADFTLGISEGKLDRRAEVTGVDEIANLASSFNQMLDRLAATLVSKDLAEQANQSKGRFIASASHELRTPLHAILGYSELLTEECAERGHTEVLPDLAKIRNSGRMLLDLVNDLLDYSKAEAGRLQLKPELVPVASVIQEVAGMIEPLAKKNGNQVVAERLPEDATVYADRGKFLQSLLNLAGNACKFTESGTVTLSRAPVSSDHQRCGISVSDTGIGIARDKIGQLFEAFVQIDSANTRKYGGTGLGLAVSRKFCRQMGGDISVESELGQGSTFTIWLPRGPAAAEIPAQELTDAAETRDEASVSDSRRASD
jgi:signal transduction histidine kinase